MVGIFAMVLVNAFVLKDTMNSTILGMMKQRASPESIKSEKVLADSLYNYSKNGGSYEVTFLEFGSTGCPTCKRMESVMDEIRLKFPDRVNVVFLKYPQTRKQGFNEILWYCRDPTQVLLDKQGKEFFRHSGFISTGDLEKEF